LAAGGPPPQASPGPFPFLGHVDLQASSAAGAAGSPGHTHHHDHGVIGDRPDVTFLTIALVLIVGFMAVEVVASIFSGSLALLSDAGHMLTDALALAASLWAARLAARPAGGAWTFGLKRAEIFSAAGNGATLAVVAVVVAVAAVRRLVAPPGVEGSVVIVVALVGVGVNLAAAWALARTNRRSLNVEGAFRHVVTDLYGFAATALAGAVILFTGFRRADPIASLVVVGLMVRAAVHLLRESGRIFMEGAPRGVDLAEVRAHLLRANHVIDVHDLHAWTVTSTLPALSAHVVVSDCCFSEGHAPRILDELQACLAGHFDVEHSTFQLEAAGHVEHESGTH
jgi:cobalt-zinc-cadmium efflux system protein